MKKVIIQNLIRNGLHDMWNAFMVQGVSFTKHDIPISSRSDSIPEQLIGWDEARSIYKKEIKKSKNFKYPAFIHFYMDDQKFDSKKTSIWTYPYEALKIIIHFQGIISPDFSTYSDFPEPIKIYNTYRMRAFGCFMESEGIPYIHNVRWGTKETWKYCFDGIPVHGVVAVGTVASGLRRKENRKLFEEGFRKMIEIIQPKVIIIYGSSDYDVIKEAESQGITIIAFESKTSLAFKKTGGE